MGRSGSALLPLHGGRVPAWLARRMERLGRVIIEALVHHYGRDEVLQRLAHPFWFQSFGAVMGMDWHSSGITTSVLGALKRGLAPVADELGLYVCGGRGRHSRKTPEELVLVGERVGVDGDALARTSRLVAKVDSAAVQDGFELYLHGFIAAADGKWTVVQQGMNTDRLQARRYHWLSEGLTSFVDDPHNAIDGRSQGEIVNLADKRAAKSRSCQLALVHDGPDVVVNAVRKLRLRDKPRTDVAPCDAAPAQVVLPHLSLPAHHEVTANDVVMKRLHGAIRAAAECAPDDFPSLMLTRGLGGRTLLALAMVAEVVHGAPCRFSDPARFSMAHGGKDGHPFPVPLRVFDETIRVMRSAVDRAKLGNEDRLVAIKRLDEQARTLEKNATGPSFEEFVKGERVASSTYGGMTVMGPAQAPEMRGAAKTEVTADETLEKKAAKTPARGSAKPRSSAKKAKRPKKRAGVKGRTPIPDPRQLSFAGFGLG